MRAKSNGFASVFIAGAALALLSGAASAQQPKGPSTADIRRQDQACFQCHKTVNPALAQEWHGSVHAQKGVGCYSCHRAEKSDADAFEHNGATIAVIVSPQDCGRCHQNEVDQQKGSHHAKAGEILASLDNFLGEVVGGPPAVAVGCFQCHGSTIKMLPNGKFDPATWPNTGIGRINPDGSAGSCSACHTRHRFSKAQARQPETCGKCHLGPDHPQIEVYQESKHGILWSANKDRLNLDNKSWKPGVDYTAAPSCATCHMGATRTQGVTHDVGDRISWTLRPAISAKINLVVFDDLSKIDVPEGQPLPKVGDERKGADGKVRKVTRVLTWEDRRNGMKDVCTSCHAGGQVEGFYQQFDGLVDLYNDKFAKPATAIMNELYKANKLTAAQMDEPLEWTYYELWHHEGRRARHGASMSGPDYAWWHGIYEVAQQFYFKFLPEVKQVAGDQMYGELMDKYVYSQPGHRWLKDGMSKEQLQKIQDFYKARYGSQNEPPK
jgi:hydroxylamine dehydrogenase